MVRQAHHDKSDVSLRIMQVFLVSLSLSKTDNFLISNSGYIKKYRLAFPTFLIENIEL